MTLGESFRSLMFSTRVHESTISRFIPEVCQAIINALKGKYMKMPSTPCEWKTIAEKFYELWDFPHCIGALDGKHISFRAPQSAGSYYYNYKGFHSVVLLGLVDAEYKFVYAHVGTNGRISDGGVFRESNLSKIMESNSINLPNPEPLPGGEKNIPYVIVADDAFPLLPYILKPYSQRNLTNDRRIFNYRLSRARRIVENGFGILANRFRILLGTINLKPDKVDLITYCCVVLHNFLITENKTACTDFLNKANQKTLIQASVSRSNRSSVYALDIREEFKNFFNGPVGHRNWQDSQVANSNF